MICITIAQESRHLLLADMLNAVQMGADLLEIRLDCLDKAPSFSEMLSAKRLPLLFSCRRPRDGGNWQGTEEERLMLLRQAIMSKADYVEIEYDIAEEIRPFPGCKRVISYTNKEKMPSAIGDIYEDMLTLHPDVIKLTVRARTPEEAWPLVQILGKPKVPTVVVGLGRPGVMLAVLGHKIGAPWTAAALERGSEAYPGQPTIRDLEHVYAYRDIGKPTRFVGISGQGEREFAATALMNTAFQTLKLPHRVLPLQVGNLKLFRKVMDAVRLQGVMMDEAFYGSLHETATLDESARTPVSAADMLMPMDGEWLASNAFGAAAISAMDLTLRTLDPESDNPFKGRVVMFAGTGPMTRMLAPLFKELGSPIVFSGKQRDESLRLSKAFGGRQIPWDGIYANMHDILIISRDGPPPTDESLDEELPLHPGYLRSGMCIFDATSFPQRSKFLVEAAARGCKIVSPRSFLIEYVREQVRRITGMEVPREPLIAKADEWITEEEEER